MEAGKLAMSFLPNIEPVTLFIILYALTFGANVFYAIAIFVMIEGLLYGFGLWWFSYLYIWPLLAGMTLLFRKHTSLWFWTVFSAVYGLLFGFLTSFVTLAVSGPKAAFSYFIAGIPFDLLHGAGNLAMTLVLFVPLKRVLSVNRLHPDRIQEVKK